MIAEKAHRPSEAQLDLWTAWITIFYPPWLDKAFQV